MTPPLEVILASQSPRRRDLLDLIGITHVVRPADIDESVLPHEAPVPHCERLARTKAGTLAALAPASLVIAADTIVVLDDAILGKPADVAEARATLARLSGRTHTVHTAMAVAFEGRTASAVESVQVTFRSLTADEIAAYVATGEPMDKAGAYGIQGYGATLVDRIDGDYFSVMGLGLRRLVALVTAVGIHYTVGVGLRSHGG